MAKGVDAIKIYNGISAPVLQAIIQTARRKQLPVVGHVPRAITAHRAVSLGLQVIEHSPIRAVDLESRGVLTPSDAEAVRASESVTEREAIVWQRIDLNGREVATLIAQLQQRRYSWIQRSASMNSTPCFCILSRHPTRTIAFSSNR